MKVFSYFVCAIFLMIVVSASNDLNCGDHKTSFDCQRFSNSSAKCCWFESNSTSASESMNKKCKLMDASMPDIGSLKSNLETYEYTCSSKAEPTTDLCLKQNMIGVNSADDCISKSTAKNSCCLMVLTGMKSCQWLGTKFSGKTKVGVWELEC